MDNILVKKNCNKTEKNIELKTSMYPDESTNLPKVRMLHSKQKHGHSAKNCLKVTHKWKLYV